MSRNNTGEYVLELRGISKVFPGVKALDNVSFGVRRGEIHALVGENGAGKSTLINIISGVFPPTYGSVLVEGEETVIHSPQDAFRQGISVVHQERNLIDTFTIGENVCLNYITGKLSGTVDAKAMDKMARKALDRVGLNLSPDGSLENLTSGKKQMLEIARALTQNSRLLLLDEPTASISLGEAETLLQTVEALRDEGVSIIYISHKLEEIFRIADRITVIRDGQKIGETLPASSLDRERLIQLMVGRKAGEIRLATRELSGNDTVLEAKNVVSALDRRPKSFALKKGEILGWYGLVGAGRTEFARQLIGVDPVTGGELLLRGKPVSIRSYRQAIRRHKLFYISENRKEEGLFLGHTIASNIVASSLQKITGKLRLISYRKKKEMALEYSRQLNVKSTGIQSKVVNLSGGNQQKVLLAKGIATDPEIMIIDEPTVGIDVGTKAEIHKLIHKLSQEGLSVIVISSDLTEILQLSDRLLVFREGEIKGELHNTKDYGSMSQQVMHHILGTAG